MTQPTPTNGPYKFTTEDKDYLAANWPPYRSRRPEAAAVRDRIFAEFEAKGVHRSRVYDVLQELGVTGPARNHAGAKPADTSLAEGAVLELEELFTELLGEFDAHKAEFEAYKSKSTAAIDATLTATVLLQEEVRTMGTEIDRLEKRVLALESAQPPSPVAKLDAIRAKNHKE